MTSERDNEWRGTEPPRAGPSTPQDLQFNPVATGLAVLTGVAIPAVVVGYTRPAGPDAAIIVIGVIAGIVAGLIAGMWGGHRKGRVYRGGRL